MNLEDDEQGRKEGCDNKKQGPFVLVPRAITHIRLISDFAPSGHMGKRSVV